MSLRRREANSSVNLKEYSTIGIGGEAKHFFWARNFSHLDQIAKGLKSPFYVLGGGSNLLISDSFIDTPIVKLGRGFSYVKSDGSLTEAGSATPLTNFLDYCLKNNFGGVENLAGIPATIGGLLMTNASSFGKGISLHLEAVEVLKRSGDVRRLGKEDVVFGYRTSSFKDDIILRAWFKLPKVKGLKTKINGFLKKRLARQDFNFPSCGCIFKNPYSRPAGLLIDSCGLKGLRRNGASVSPKHANFIINLGGAKYRDVDYLINIVKEKVYNKFRVILEEEIERWH